MKFEAVRAALEGRAVRTTDENELANVVERLFEEANVDYEREVRLSSRDRVDFLVDRVAIELKVEGSASQIIRQLDRYAQSDRVDHLVLVTTRRKHMLLMPDALHGKPVSVVCMGAL